MSQLFKILQHYNESEETFVRNVFHSLEDVVAYNYPKDLGFCNPNEIKIIEELNKHFQLDIKSNGGYQFAERKKIVVQPKEYQVIPEITIYELLYNRKFNSLEHKHIMGSLYNLGINERLIGDIIVSEDARVQLIICNTLSENLPLLQTKFGKVSVEYKKVDEVTITNKKLKNMVRSSKTKRLDSVCKSIVKSSRTQMGKEIKKGNISLNYKVVKDQTTIVNVGDILSVRGYGRATIIDIIEENGKYNIKYLTTNYN